MVCHKGKMICIDAVSVADHLAHGCTIGSCQVLVRGELLPGGDLSAWTLSELSIYPNPMISRTRIEFRLAYTTSYTLEVYDIRGAKIRQLATGNARAGTTVGYELNAGDYAKGVYFIRLKSEKEMITRRMVMQGK